MIKEPRLTPVLFQTGTSVFLKSAHGGGQNMLYSGWDSSLGDHLFLTVPGNNPITFRFSSRGVEKM